MLVAMSKWTALAVLGTTFGAGLATGWMLLHTKAPEGAALAAVAPSAQPGIPPTPRTEVPPAPAPVAARPPQAPAAGVKAVPTPGHFFRLGPSDTLSEVAKKAYGTTKRVADLQRANPALDPKNLKAGTVIYVPAGREPVPALPATAETPKGASAAKPTPVAAPAR